MNGSNWDIWIFLYVNVILMNSRMYHPHFDKMHLAVLEKRYFEITTNLQMVLAKLNFFTILFDLILDILMEYRSWSLIEAIGAILAQLH